MDDMNLNETKREPLRKQTDTQKREMLRLNARRGVTLSILDPVWVVKSLAEWRGKGNLLCRVRVNLATNQISWIRSFGVSGLRGLLSVLKKTVVRDPLNAVEAVKCISFFVNSKFGMEEALSLEEFVLDLYDCLEKGDDTLKYQIMRILAVVTLYPNGHHVLLSDLMTHSERTTIPRFYSVVQAVEQTHSPQLRSMSLQFINAIVTTPDEWEFRQHLRAEVLRLGLADLLKNLQNSPLPDLQTHAQLFVELMNADWAEFGAAFQDCAAHFGSLQSCLDAIRTSPHDRITSILQHLIFVRDEPLVRDLYLQLIETCVGQIVLRKNGLDPDPAYHCFEFDVEDIISVFEGRLSQTAADIAQLRKEYDDKLTVAITAKTEAQTNVELLQAKVDRLMEESKTMIHANQDKGVSPRIDEGTPPPPMLDGKVPPPPPPMMGGKVPLPPPPLIGGKVPSPPSPMVGGSVPPPPPMMGGKVPTPPPPMMGGKVPTPPPPMMGGNVPPPPPMMGGKVATPPPPMSGGSAPPPPPGITPIGVKSSAVPVGMKAKPVYPKSQTATKRLNWDKLRVTNIRQDCVWTTFDDEEFVTQDIQERTVQLFAVKETTKKSLAAPAKKVKELMVLEGKVAQNFAIMFGQMRKKADEIKQAFLRLDSPFLSITIVEQFIKNLPGEDQLDLLAGMDIDKLQECEQYLAVIGGVKCLGLRLECFLISLQYPDLLSETKAAIATVIDASSEVLASSKLSRILQLILSVGNILNANSRNADTYAFNLKYLTKVIDTKSADNSTNLLNYVALLAEDKCPDALTFPSDLISASKASLVKKDEINRSIDLITRHHAKVSKAVDQYHVEDPDDGFLRLFGKLAEDMGNDIELINKMRDGLQESYTKVAEHFSFTEKTMPSHEFFAIVAAFSGQFSNALQSNLNIKMVAEKKERADRAKEKAEEEKRMRSTVVKEDEGVVDSLLEALKTGRALNKGHEQRKRRRPQLLIDIQS